MAVGFGRTRETATPGVYQVVIEYLDEQPVVMPLELPCGCAKVWLTRTYAPGELEEDIKDLRELCRDAL
jgi:cyanophycin synthetase